MLPSAGDEDGMVVCPSGLEALADAEDAAAAAPPSSVMTSPCGIGAGGIEPWANVSAPPASAGE